MSSRNRRLTVVILLLLLVVIVLLLARCNRHPEMPAPSVSATPTRVESAPSVAPTAARAPSDEVLTAATLQAPPEVLAGASFRVDWTGPDNPGDYVTIVTPTAPPADYSNYRETKLGHSVDLLAPIDAGDYELRYVTAHSKTVLGRAALKVLPATASLEAPASALLGASIAIAWKGPNNAGDYITIVAAHTPDGQHGAYADTAKGSPATLALPTTPGDAELRYVTGQGNRVLARRAIRLLSPDITLDAPPRVIAGSLFNVTCSGPKNPGDYVTIVPKSAPDGQHQNYTDVAKGSPLPLTAPMWTGDAELRYMPAAGDRVLARRAIDVVAAQVTLDAVPQAPAGSRVEIKWTGPANRGDYITIVPKSARDGVYARYADVSKGSPMFVEAPAERGPCEIRYMSGQGAKVLARRVVETTAP